VAVEDRRATASVGRRAPILRSFVVREWPLLAVVVLVLLSTFVHLWWLNRFRDGFPLDIDESRYLQFGMSLKDALADGGVRGFWRIWEAQRDFGPLLPLTSVPVYVILGESVLNGMATQLVFFAVLALASYGIGTRLTSRTGGALVALVVATAPAVVDFTRTYQFPVTAAAIACGLDLRALGFRRSLAPRLVDRLGARFLA